MTDREYEWLLAIDWRKHPDDSDPTDEQLLELRRAIVDECAREAEQRLPGTYGASIDQIEAAARIRALSGRP